MKRYKNVKWGFSLSFPPGWKKAGFFKTITSDQATNPEFFGPKGSSIKFAVGPISPQTTAEGQIDLLQNIAMKYGHEVVGTDIIEVNGAKSAVVITNILGLGVLKNYSLIFDGIEYLVTASGDFLESDKIVKSFVI